MNRHRARIKKMEQQLQPNGPPKIIILWTEDEEPPPAEPGEEVIQITLRWDDSPEIETS